MKTQTPNPRTTTPQTASHLTAEGKMKAPTGMPALSLQDVFPESASTTGSYQETIRLFEIEQEKGAQLEEKWNLKSKKNGRGGRKKLQANQKKTIKLQIHINAQEYEILTEQHQISGLRYLSDT